jgi:Mce-associated membrane protein
VEDQPTDASDLTETAASGEGGTAASSGAVSRGAVPVGKSSGRHRTFRPRPVAATPAASDAATGDAPGETVAETVEAESPAVEETVEKTVADTVEDTVEAEAPVAEETVAAEAPTKSSAKAKRRRWFRGRAAADATSEVAEEPAAASEITESADSVEEFPAEEPNDEPDAKRVGPKPVGRRLVIAVAVAAALFVAAGAFGGAMLQPYLADRAVANTKLNVARTAAAAITTLFTYTPDDMDQLAARSAKYLGGDLRDSYAKQVDALAATNKQNQIKRSAQVVGAAVESLNGPNATAMVYANVTYNSAAVKDVPKIFLVSYRLTMQRKGSDWVITNMPWITSKDLTRVTP